MADIELRNIIKDFRVSDLRALLGFASLHKTGKKQDLQCRALGLLGRKSSAVEMKIRELHCQRYQLTSYEPPHPASVERQEPAPQEQASDAELRNMIMTFRVSDLRVLLGLVGLSKTGKKQDLQYRALGLLDRKSSAVEWQIRELHSQQYQLTSYEPPQLTPVERQEPASQEQASDAELHNMIMTFRVSDLRVLLGLAGLSKTGKKQDLQYRALGLLDRKSSTAEWQIRELHSQQYQLTSYEPFQPTPAESQEPVHAEQIEPVMQETAPSVPHDTELNAESPEPAYSVPQEPVIQEPGIQEPSPSEQEEPSPSEQEKASPSEQEDPSPSEPEDPSPSVPQDPELAESPEPAYSVPQEPVMQEPAMQEPSPPEPSEEEETSPSAQEDSSPSAQEDPSPSAQEGPLPSEQEEPSPSEQEEPSPSEQEEPSLSVPQDPEHAESPEPAYSVPQELAMREAAHGEPQEPAPALSQEPAPPLPHDPSPALPQDPAPALSQEPAPDLSQEPAPALPQELAPALPQDPAPALPQEPAPAELQEPACVKFKDLCFYDNMYCLMQPCNLPSLEDDRLQEEMFFFMLTPEQSQNVAMSWNINGYYEIQILLRFCIMDTSCTQEDIYPKNVRVKLNYRQVKLPQVPIYRPGVKSNRPSKPVNLTSSSALSPSALNVLHITYTSTYGRTFAVGLFISRQLTTTSLLQRIQSKGIQDDPEYTTAMIKEKFKQGRDANIATTSLRVSLVCPLGKMRMNYPCRAVTCTHLQCFDAFLYLEMNEKKPTWICPVCCKPAPLEDLSVDKLIADIVQKVPPDCTVVQFHEDGSWAPVVEEKKTKKSVPVDVVDILSDSEYVDTVDILSDSEYVEVSDTLSDSKSTEIALDLQTLESISPSPAIAQPQVLSTSLLQRFLDWLVRDRAEYEGS